MAAYLGKTEVGVRRTGSTVRVPDYPRAKLMYYLSCITSVLEVERNSDLQRLTDFRNYDHLSESDVDRLVLLCALISPDLLLDKCIFLNEVLCGNSSNEFYEFSQVKNHLLLTESIVIGGQRRRVCKIMAYKPSWLRENWNEPMEFFSGRRRRLTSQSRRESDCVIS